MAQGQSAVVETKVTQPAIFLHSVILAKTMGEEFKPDMVAGHSLGEFSALVAAGALSFEEGLKLVSARAQAMQHAGQVVISGTIEGVDAACAKMLEAGAKRALKLKVGGAFHSPLMQPAADKLSAAIEAAEFHTPVCPVYQNVDGKPHTDPKEIKANLLAQLTAPVRWTYDVQAMIADGADSFTELGPGNVLQGLVKKIDRSVATEGRQ